MSRMSTTDPAELTDGLWRWTARHPEWHPEGFGDEVAAYALDAGDVSLLIDPMLPPEPEPVLDLVDRLARKPLAIFITIPYHVRDAEEIWRRHRANVTIYGHPLAAKRLDDSSGFTPIAPGDELPAGVTAHRIGKPRRSEQPLYLPSHDAIAFGDAVVEVDGDLRVWVWDEPKSASWYRDDYIPTLEPLLDLNADRVLVTHGEPTLEDGRERLQRALEAGPWDREDR